MKKTKVVYCLFSKWYFNRNKVYFFRNKDVKVYNYDVEKNVSGFKTYLKFKHSRSFSCTKLPMRYIFDQVTDINKVVVL